MTASPSQLKRYTALAAAVIAPAAGLAIHPVIGIMLTAAPATVVACVLTTALYGSDRLSKRAFRLLRLVTNRSEPPTRRRVISAQANARVLMRALTREPREDGGPIPRASSGFVRDLQQAAAPRSHGRR
ncbi:hypothetical protein [Sphaerisporangium sp. TRM90804]|uniref:hypothetical protein n=1 Tax=Sphaerisporangium sp. TRM90804 TaxID=3031113 RepID=UPI0024497E38|nr:hypothetical protein [Sphaerisporangium sp. TRM90804]MDH2426455.1 hypothetical protein [Sphaerisporangium sp. TRM90804]